VFSDGLDYVVLRIGEDKSLCPIPDVPRFDSMQTARRWLKSSEAEALAGMKLAVVRFHALADLVAETRVALELKDQSRFRIGDDE
jgi:hypothetical protein